MSNLYFAAKDLSAGSPIGLALYTLDLGSPMEMGHGGQLRIIVGSIMDYAGRLDQEGI